MARMLVKEAIHYRFRPRVLLSRPCIYGVFDGKLGGFWPRNDKCVGCMRCVMEYPEICRVEIDSGYKALGDSYFTPDAIATLHAEATTGEVPVKGVGYKGPFTGEGFDGIWTDMSEIVRPTRDGIYGRETISTSVDVGRKPSHLLPDALAEGSLQPILELPVPLIFDELPELPTHPTIRHAALLAAQELGTLSLLGGRSGLSAMPDAGGAAVPVVEPGQAGSLESFRGAARMVEVRFGDPKELDELMRLAKGLVVCVRLPLGKETLGLLRELAGRGVGVFHLTANYHGLERVPQDRPGRFLTEALLEIHRALVADGLRDQLTIIASGGIIRAEHVPKAILCGADLVALDTALLVALGATFHGECANPEDGTLRMRRIDPVWGKHRLVNLVAAWRNQLLEILSAMGLREVRRLRGETGRAMFFEELEKEAFAWAKR